MSLAADTREAARARPFLVDALRAGVVNYAAAARSLGVAEDTEAVATALRRYAEGLPDLETEPREARVTMHRDLDALQTDALVAVAGERVGPGDRDLTGVVARGDVDAAVLGAVLERLSVEGVEPVAAGVAGAALAMAVDRRDGPTAVRLVEAALDAVPAKPTV